MFERLKAAEERYEIITEELTKAASENDIKTTTELAKEQADLKDMVDGYRNYKETEKQLEESKELLEDPDMKELAKEEIPLLEAQLKEIEEQLQILLIPKDPDDDKNIVMEIRGAAGGDEANIFAGDLYRMYSRYAESQGWRIEEHNVVEGTSGGFAQIEFAIKGKNVYSKLKYESGSHRVQRVPATESQGRVHTSTATVLVMPEVKDVDIEINEKDLKIDVYRSGGAGGQCVNTTDSAVRITHLPTNTVVTCQNERSQIKNKAKAMEILKIRLYDEEKRKLEEAVGSERRSKIGSGDRSEKIRTYNYPQNRVTDHRIHFTINQLDKVMEGNLDKIIEALINEDQKRKLKGEE